MQKNRKKFAYLQKKLYICAGIYKSAIIIFYLPTKQYAHDIIYRENLSY